MPPRNGGHPQAYIASVVGADIGIKARVPPLCAIPTFPEDLEAMDVLCTPCGMTPHIVWIFIYTLQNCVSGLPSHSNEGIGPGFNVEAVGTNVAGTKTASVKPAMPKYLGIMNASTKVDGASFDDTLFIAWFQGVVPACRMMADPDSFGTNCYLWV